MCGRCLSEHRVINAKYAFTVQQMKKWGYQVADEIVWIKKTNKGNIAKGHGFYLQHAKETCIVGVKVACIVSQQNKHLIKFNGNVGRDLIFSERRGQSQKPNEIYEIIEEMVPQGRHSMSFSGFYLEIFGRRNNLRDRWVTIGNEL